MPTEFDRAEEIEKRMHAAWESGQDAVGDALLKELELIEPPEPDQCSECGKGYGRHRGDCDVPARKRRTP